MIRRKRAEPIPFPSAPAGYRYVPFATLAVYCTRCGASVVDIGVHDAWHAAI